MKASSTLPLFLLSLSAAAVWANNAAANDNENNKGSTGTAVEQGDVWKPTTVKFSKDTLLEQFASKDALTKSWTISRASKQNDIKEETDKDLYRYKGEWEVEEPTALAENESKDYGLVLKNAAAHHAISKTLEKPINFKSQKHVTIQYEVKLQNDLECGGAYMKLLHHDQNFVPAQFSDSSPYSIMFGPDKCGSTNKVHFIFRYKNPKSGKTIEHHLKNSPAIPSTTDKMTHLYTLKLFPQTNRYELLIDNKREREGSLYEDFEPSVIPPQEIDDPSDKKPSDWIDEAKIPDSQAKKPDDWDENAPREIEDIDAEIPNDWLVDEPDSVPDPNAVKPEDWNDEEDGTWVAPSIANPKCATVSGCGEWKRPMKKNPAYKGKWSPPLINNPAYEGPWSPKKILNPDYFEEKKVGENLLPIGAVGFELWTMQSDILFDNILITSDPSSVIDSFISDTFTRKHDKESSLSKTPNFSTDSPLSPSNWREYFKDAKPLSEQFSVENLNKVIKTLHLEPEAVLKELPVLVGSIALVALLLPLKVLLGMLTGNKKDVKKSASASQKSVDEVSENKEDVEDSASDINFKDEKVVEDEVSDKENTDEE